MATLRLALPMMLGQAAQLLMHVIDSVMVGNLGIKPLAASAMGNAAAALIFFVGVGTGSTVPVLVARAFGADDRARMNFVLRHGLTISFCYGVGSTLLFAAASPWILPLFGPAELVGPARTYAVLLVASLIPAFLVQNLRGFAEAQQHPWLPLGNIALGIALNVAFNSTLIYGHFGVPALGLPGAALGTLLARLCMLAHFVWLLNRRPAIAPAPGVWRPVRWRDGFYGKYFRVALPMAAIFVVLSGNTVVIGALMGRLGLTALAAGEIGRQLWLLLFSLPLGFSFAVAIRAGHAAGAGDPATIRRIASSSLVAVAGTMTLVALAIVLARHAIARAFLDPAQGGSEAVVTLAGQILIVVACAIVADSITATCLGVFRGLATLRAPAAIYATGIWLVGLPLGYVLGFPGGHGALGVWLGVATGSVIAATAFFLLLGWRLRNQPVLSGGTQL